MAAYVFVAVPLQWYILEERYIRGNGEEYMRRGITIGRIYERNMEDRRERDKGT
jgi:hypothetical protein